MTFLHSQLADEKGTWQSTGNHHPCQDFVMWLQVLESLNHSSSKQSKGPTVSYSPSLQYMLHILSHAVLDNNIEEIIGQICFLQELCARSIFLLALAKALQNISVNNYLATTIKRHDSHKHWAISLDKALVMFHGQ